MNVRTTYTRARERLAFLLDKVTEDREIVIIQRRGREDVAMIAADELSGILATIHLSISPDNAKRLMISLERVKRDKIRRMGKIDAGAGERLDADASDTGSNPNGK